MIFRAPLLARVFVLTCTLFLLQNLAAQAADGESFTIHLENYFVELQGGQRVDLDVHYQYAPHISRADIPDYRAVQILVEDALYGMPDSNPYWEITNREIVHRLLQAFPQFPEVTSTFNIHPRGLLNIRRGSTVSLSQADLKDGGPLLTTLDQDAYYQARAGAYNILVPRPLKASVAALLLRVKNSLENAHDPHGVVCDLPCFPLAGNEFTFDGLLTGLKPGGPYDAIVLPENAAPATLVKIADLGLLQGIVKVQNAGEPDLGNRCLVETSLGFLLGLKNSPGTHELLPLADAREGFFTKSATSLIVEEKYAWPYRLRKYQIEPWGAEMKLGLFVQAAAKDTPVPKIILPSSP